MNDVTLHLVVPITTPGFRDEGELNELAGPGVRITRSQIAEGPASIECDLDEALAAPGVAECALQAERAGADAVVIDCMGDPGLEAAREVVQIPVLGPCLSSMHTAAMLAHRFSILTVLDRLVPSFERRAAVYGLTSMASVRAVDVPVLDLEAQRSHSIAQLVHQGIAAIEQDGAHALVFGCTGMLGWAEELEHGLADAGYDGVPVIDPIPSTLRGAEALVRSGLRHSKRTYPAPPPKQRSGLSFAS